MLLIVLCHFCAHGEWPADIPFVSKIAINAMSVGGKLGVDVFVIITGYFLICSKFKARSFMRTLFPTIFYGVVLAMLCYFAPESEWSLKAAVKSLTISGLPWFVSAYMGLYLLSPFLNKFAHSMTQGQLRSFLILMTVLMVLIPTVPGFALYGFNTMWFMYLYLCAGYYRLYGIETLDRYHVFLFIVSSFGLVLSTILLNVVGQWIPIFSSNATYFASMNSILVVATAFSLLVPSIVLRKFSQPSA